VSGITICESATTTIVVSTACMMAAAGARWFGALSRRMPEVQ
jgi:hypothetical protein